jgi:SAM-dependent methyltransferase
MPVTHPQPRPDRARSFGPAALLYDQVRPSYPVVAIRWALAPLGPGRHRIADVGAGTGILTRVLISMGQEVVAVEPDPRMRERLGATTAEVSARERAERPIEVVEGRAEAVPVPDGSLDGAAAGQAYHWFDPELAHRELARVIRPGGVFAAVWNERDTTVPWLAEYSRIVDSRESLPSAHVDRGPGRYSGRGDVTSFGDPFDPVQWAEFRHTVTCTPDLLVSLLQTRSYFLTAPRARQVELTAAVRRLAQEHPDLAGAARFPLPYVTEVFRARRR